MKISKIYKYRKINIDTISMLIKQEIYLAHAIQFNDPFDSIINILKEQEEHKIVNWPYYGGICSFSRKYDQIQMWSHYAQSHEGICIGLKTLYLKDNYEVLPMRKIESKKDIGVNINGHKFLSVKNVIYTNKRPNPVPVDNLSNLDCFENILTKQKYWEYEKECRIIETESCKAYFDIVALDSIYFGMKIKKSDKDLLLDIVDKYYLSNGLKIKLYQVKESKDKFKLLFDSI